MAVRNILKLIGKWLLRAFCFLCILLVICHAVQRIQGVHTPLTFGWGTAVVTTGSMEPNVPVGSLAFVQKASKYEPGDIILYEDTTGSSVMHRLVSIVDGVVIAKGDANNAEDHPFFESQIIGKAQFILPAAGTLLLKLKEPVTVLVLVLIIVLSYAIPLILRRKEQKKYE